MAKTLTLDAGDLGLMPGQGTRSHMLQLNIPKATTKTWCSQINKYFLKLIKETQTVTVCISWGAGGH